MTQPYKVTVHEVRKITSDITPLVNTIYNNFEYISDDPQLGHNKQEISKLLVSTNMVSLFVYDKGKVVGYIVGEIKRLDDGRTCYYITYFFTAPSYREKRLGSQLINILVDKCKQWQIKYIILTCDSHDKKLYDFYKRRGFSPDPMLKTFKRHEVITRYL